jgi:hypothetical protein
MVEVDVGRVDDGKCAMASPRCRVPERGDGEVARIAIDEVAATDLARTEL